MLVAAIASRSEMAPSPPRLASRFAIDVVVPSEVSLAVSTIRFVTNRWKKMPAPSPAPLPSHTTTYSPQPFIPIEDGTWSPAVVVLTAVSAPLKAPSACTSRLKMPRPVASWPVHVTVKCPFMSIATDEYSCAPAVVVLTVTSPPAAVPSAL